MHRPLAFKQAIWVTSGVFMLYYTFAGPAVVRGLRKVLLAVLRR